MSQNLSKDLQKVYVFCFGIHFRIILIDLQDDGAPHIKGNDVPFADCIKFHTNVDGDGVAQSTGFVLL